MSTKIPVSALYDNCKMMLEERWGYIYKRNSLFNSYKQDLLDLPPAPDMNWGKR